MKDDTPAPDEDDGRFLGLAATIFYGLMAIGAYALMAGFDLDVGATIFGGPESDAATAAALGAGAGLLIVGLSHFGRDAGPMKALRREMKDMLGRPSDATILTVAAASAIGEELLFRGAMQPLLGVWPTIVIFGLLHGGGMKKLWAWTVFALLGGAAFAALTLFTESLLAAIVMHFTVNYFNLLALTREEPSPPAVH